MHQFLDELVAAGSEGGHRAASHLIAGLEAYGRRSLNSHSSWKMIVRVYFNKTGLVKTYVDANIVPDAQVVEDFIVGFNQEQPFLEFIDAGPDKEAADTKIKGEAARNGVKGMHANRHARECHFALVMCKL